MPQFVPISSIGNVFTAPVINNPPPPPPPPPPPDLLVPDVGNNGFAVNTASVSYKIGNGDYATKNDATRVDDPTIIGYAKRYAERTPARILIGGYSNELATAQAAINQALQQDKCLLIYVYNVNWRDGNKPVRNKDGSVTYKGAKDLADYQNTINGIINIVPPALKVIWLCEPDGLAWSFDANLVDPITGEKVLTVRNNIIKWLMQRLTSHAYKDNWTVLIDASTPGWRNGAYMVDRFMDTEAWRADGLAVGTASFRRFNAGGIEANGRAAQGLHSFAEEINANTKLKKYWPRGMPYMMESFGSDGTSQQYQPLRNVTGLSTTAGSPIVNAPSGTFQVHDGQPSGKGEKRLDIKGIDFTGHNTDGFIVTVKSSSQVILATNMPVTLSNVAGVVNYDRRDAWCNPIGPVCGPPGDWRAGGGYDGKANCIGAMHFTNALVSNNTWDPPTQTEIDPGPGGPLQDRIRRHVVPSKYFKP